MPHIAEYLKKIEKASAAGNATEHTHRPALQALIESLSDGITATNEPKRIKCGAPDFIVTRGQTPLGYIEAKDVGVPLEREERSPQMKRYRESLGNLILTDYLEFRWYVRGELRQTARLAHADARSKLRIDADGETEVTGLLSAFLNTHEQTVGSAKELAVRMAAIAQLIRDTISRALADEDLTDDRPDPLHDQLKGFRDVLIHDLTEAQFADMYAQTICYGLFAARCNARGGAPFTRVHAAHLLPKTNPFLRKMFNQIAGPDLDERVAWAVDDLAELLNRTDIGAVLKDFGHATRREDPVVHFYETFLAAYDPAMREARGVYYTPEPVVSYIIRSVDHLLKTDFKLAAGLGDASRIKIKSADGKSTDDVHKVLILDPATGTGTFLYGVINHIFESFKQNRGMWSAYVSEHLLPRVFGFELLMAPYAVAHMKLGLQLSETGYAFNTDERLRVYLTNTLEEAHGMSKMPLFTQWLAEEANAASRVKQEVPVMVVLGNPPYSGHSANVGEWIANLLRGTDTLTGQKTGNYFEVDGQPLGEKNPKWINDDYVKFIRFAQWRIEQTGYGVLAFITNHGYLDNPTFRGMRQSLMETFDDIYVLDLHGNSKKKERAPDGSKDENVFDIQQGVAIGIFVKKKRNAAVPAAVVGASRSGKRASTDTERGQDALTTASGDAGATTSSAMTHAIRPRFGEITIRDRGRLPHWEKEGGIYFVTFRLVDSLPQSVLRAFKAERENIIRTAKQLGRELTAAEHKRLAELFSERIESYLDAGIGACHLKDPRIAEMVANALRYFDGKRYWLFAWCVMPNHAHVVMRPRPGHALADILHSWKSFTAKEANRILNSQGTFWEREYYDHLIRNEEEFYRIIRYVIDNPKKANLQDWPWVGVSHTVADKRASTDTERGQDALTTASGDAGATIVRHAHLWGVREVYEENAQGERVLTGGKYRRLWQHDVSTTEWKTLEPQAPFYLFVPQDVNLRVEYERGWKVTEMMPVNVLGFQTHRDHFAINFDEEHLRARVIDLRGTKYTDDELRDIYELRDNRDWQLSAARRQLRGDKDWARHLIRCLYRPFDWRFCYFSTVAMDYPRRELLDHVAGKENLSLNTVRQTKMESWQHAVVSNAPAPAVYVELKDGSNLFPLYLYPTSAKAHLFDTDEPTDAPGGRRPNFAPEFVKDFAARLGMTFIADSKGNCNAAVPAAVAGASRSRMHGQDARVDSQPEAGATNALTFGPEDVFDYMYAVFHSPTFRRRYAEFLKIDFPRLPLTSNANLFRALCELGAQLVALHLMEARAPEIATFPQTGSNTVENVRYTAPGEHGADEGRVFVNREQYFAGVPPEVWNFHVGGYQICQKWLKDRKGRQLTYNDLAHYTQIVAALNETIRLMAEIDSAIETHGGWPLIAECGMRNESCLNRSV